jgi:hypothetical protein
VGTTILHFASTRVPRPKMLQADLAFELDRDGGGRAVGHFDVTGLDVDHEFAAGTGLERAVDLLDRFGMSRRGEGERESDGDSEGAKTREAGEAGAAHAKEYPRTRARVARKCGKPADACDTQSRATRRMWTRASRRV